VKTALGIVFIGAAKGPVAVLTNPSTKIDIFIITVRISRILLPSSGMNPIYKQERQSLGRFATI
jgi:hypothetical protein